MKRPTLGRSRQRRRKTPAPPLSRSEELLAISQFIAKHGATRAPIHPEYDHISFEDPRTIGGFVKICLIRMGRLSTGVYN